REARRRFASSRPYVEALEDRTVPTAVAAPSGLVSWWTGNNTGADAVGGNNATLLGNTTYATGEVGKAFSFWVNDKATVPDSDSLKFTSSMSIEGWIKIDYLRGGNILFRGDDRGGWDPYILGFGSDGRIGFSICPSNTNGNSVNIYSPPIPLG